MNNIIRKKCLLFTEEECMEKLVEEISEALTAARNYLCSLRCDRDPAKAILRRKALAEELADVYVAGIATMGEMRPYMKETYDTKVVKGIYKQMQAAIDQRENNETV